MYSSLTEKKTAAAQSRALPIKCPCHRTVFCGNSFSAQWLACIDWHDNILYLIFFSIVYYSITSIVLRCAFNQSIIINNKRISCPLQGPGGETLQVKTIKSICIPAYSEALVEVNCPKRFRRQNIIIDPIKHSLNSLSTMLWDGLYVVLRHQTGQR